MKVSNSQMVTFSKCPKRFYFSHRLNLRPKHWPEPMQKGIDGHEMMEAFFCAMRDGNTYEECVEAVNLVLPRFIGQPSMTVYRHVIAFGAYAFQQKWKIISSEVNSIEPMEQEGMEFAYTPDILAEFGEGPQTGYQFMLDFKFTGQYWNDREIQMYQQLPKYMIYHNKTAEKKIRHAALVMLNTRAAQAATGTNLFKVSWLPITRDKLTAIEWENEALAAQIKFAVDNNLYPRTADAYTCKMCDFADDICPAELNGRDITKMVERNYEKNTYFEDNYGKEEDD